MQSIQIKAPGRICLMGDHQDYLNLPIIACAIDRYMHLSAVPNGSDSLSIKLLDLSHFREMSIHPDLTEIAPDDYILLAIKVCSKYGYRLRCGYDITIKSDIPINAGLSSSSAFVICWIKYIIEASGKGDGASPIQIAKMAYEAEVLYQKASGGKMDQFTIAIGGTIFFDTLTEKITSFDHSIHSLVVGVSGIEKDTQGNLSDLSTRAQKTIHLVQSEVPDFNIRATSLDSIQPLTKYIPTKEVPIFEAVIKNYHLTTRAKSFFEQNVLSINAIAQLMNRHHSILKNNLEITVPRIDRMIDNALSAGALGAKIVGSGGGGCIVAIAKPKDSSSIIAALQAAGAIDSFVTTISQGVHRY